MKKTMRLILILSLVIPLLSGCSSNKEVVQNAPQAIASKPVGESASAPAGPTESAEPATTAVMGDPIVAADGGEFTGEAELVKAYPPVELQLPDPFPGEVTFEVDSGNSAQLSANPGAAQDQLVSLTTSEGMVWTLIIPPGAVSENVEIKISELKNINSVDLGGLHTGVLLEPDGLEFTLPVTLSLAGEGLGDNPVILRGSQDGSELNFAYFQRGDQDVTASLTHFSTAYGDPVKNQETLEKLKAAARKDYETVRKLAISFLKEKIFTPQPPAIPLRCTADEKIAQDREKKLDNFVEEFSMPEEAVARALLETGRSDTLLNNSNDSIELSAKVFERLMKKGNSLYKAYYPQEEYFLAITRAALTAERQYLLLGGAAEGPNFIQKSGAWARQIADQYLKDIREKHDYQLINSMITLDREAASMGAGRENPMDALRKALKFKVQTDLQATTDVEYDQVSWNTQGTADYNLFDAIDKSYRASGKGKYTGFRWPVLEDMPPVVMTSPKVYDFEVKIENFDACQKFSFDLLVNRFARDVETYASGGMELPYASGNGFVAGILLAAFEDHFIDSQEDSPWFKFTIPIQNLNEVAGEIELPRQIPNNTANLQLKLIHTPGK